MPRKKTIPATITTLILVIVGYFLQGSPLMTTKEILVIVSTKYSNVMDDRMCQAAAKYLSQKKLISSPQVEFVDKKKMVKVKWWLWYLRHRAYPQGCSLNRKTKQVMWNAPDVRPNAKWFERFWGKRFGVKEGKSSVAICKRHEYVTVGEAEKWTCPEHYERLDANAHKDLCLNDAMCFNSPEAMEHFEVGQRYSQEFLDSCKIQKTHDCKMAFKALEEGDEFFNSHQRGCIYLPAEGEKPERIVFNSQGDDKKNPKNPAAHNLARVVCAARV
jgi:hypothetical protein